MADIRIKDLTTTAAASSADDYIAVDGTSNGTRKLSAATPSFATSVTVPGVVGPTSTDLTFTGGSTGASLVLGQGTTAGSATLTATGTGIVSVAGAASSGPATYAAQSRAGFTSYQETSGSFGYNRYLDIVSAQGADGTNGGGVIRLLVNSISSGSVPSEVARVTKTGNLLIGTTTDAASLAGGLVVNGSGAGAAASSTTTGALRVTGGVGVSGAGYFGGDITRTTTSGIASIVSQTTDTSTIALLRSKADTAQATLRSEGSAVAGTLFGIARANASQLFSESGAMVVGAFGAHSLILGTNNATRLTIDSAGAATFAGAVSIGNTVAVAAAVASTHKVTMVIGGVTYYLLATNVP